MNERNGPRRFAVLYLLIFTAGMSFSLLGAMLPDISRQFGLSNREAATIPLMIFSGDFTGLLVLGLALARPRALLAAAPAAMAFSALLISILDQFSWPLLAAFYFLGLSRVVLIALPGIVISRMAAADSARALNVVYGFFSGGVMLAPVGGGALIRAGFHYPSPFLALAGLSALAAAISLLSRLKYPGLGQGLRPGAVIDLFANHRRVFVVTVLMNLCYIAAENVPNSWMPKYLEATFADYSEMRGAVALSLFWAAITAGRFGVAWLIERGLPPRAALAGLALGAAASLLAGPLIESKIGNEVLFVASGLFFSAIFPIIVSFTGHLPEKTASTLFIIIMAAGSLGAAGAGKAVGVVADLFDFRTGMMIAALLSAAILVLTPALKSDDRSTVR